MSHRRVTSDVTVLNLAMPLKRLRGSSQVFSSAVMQAAWSARSSLIAITRARSSAHSSIEMRALILDMSGFV
jgi:hypothetical protein